MNLSLMPTSASAPPSAPDAAPIAAPASGTRKIIPISAPQSVPETAPVAVGVEQLVEFDMAIGLLDSNHRITQLDQVFLLHIEQLLAKPFGFFFGRKCNFHEISHLRLLQAVRA
jgi:hypothetical protein